MTSPDLPAALFDMDEFPLFSEQVAWEHAQSVLEERGFSDGLPLVPPTEARLSAMLAGRGAHNRSFGHVMPLMGDLTLLAVAYNCVLAGCRPDELPVVLTAAEAATEEPFNLLGILSTTGTSAVAVCVHGPVVRELGINAGGNTLGPGNRANACIGRAVSLIMQNVGGARAGVGDMATMGQPGKYTFCFAEQSHTSFATLPVRRGFVPDDSCVSVLGVSGTAEVLPANPGDTPELILQPVATALSAALNVSNAKPEPQVNEHVILLPPEIANTLSSNGWDLGKVQSYLFEQLQRGGSHGTDVQSDHRLARVPEDIHPIVTGGAGIKMTCLPLWAGGTQTVTRKIRGHS